MDGKTIRNREMKARNEQYTDHEIRLRMVENAIIGIGERFEQVDKRFERLERNFERLESKMDSHHMWTVGLIIGGIFTPLILHAMHLT
jgi:hypothetical protein